MTAPRHEMTRVRHELKRRRLTVTATERLSASMLRLHFTSPDLHDFASASPGDHIKLFVPEGQGGPAMRDYTPRRFDAAAGTIVLDFALHEAGPATQWARAAQPGDMIEIGGPRGSMVVADDFDWYLLIGDETAIPSIARRLEELRPGVPVRVVVTVDGPDDQVPLAARKGLAVTWLTRVAASDDALIRAAIPSLPAGEGYVWIAAEGAVAKAVRAHVVDTLGHPRAWAKASGYWSRGEAGVQVKIAD